MIKTWQMALAAALVLPALSACTSTATPETAAQFAPKVVVTGTQPVSNEAPVMAKSGQYPTFGKPLTAANTQIDDSQALEMRAQMDGLTAQRKAGTITDAEYRKRMAELQQLAANHAAEMQAKIAN